jgi:hypothetical protein
MKKLALLSLLALMSFQSLWSQSYHPFPDTNATWCDERYDNGWPYSNYYYFFYKTNGKSTINDTAYTVISDNYSQITCYLREENKKVFCRLSPDLSEFVLYDFDIDIGDTVLLHQCYGESYNGYVEGIDSLLVGNQYHKRYFIQCWEWISLHITEGIGSDAGLMYCDLPWVDMYGSLFCFSLNDTMFSTDGSGGNEAGNCWQFIGVPETSVEHMEIYPNPVRDFIHIRYDKECRLELIDLTGRQCRQSISNSIYVHDLQQGIYFLRVYAVTGTLLNQFKILKLNER